MWQCCNGKLTVVPFSAYVWIASQALTRMSSSGELRSSTAVAGVLLSTGRGSNCEHEEKDLYLVYVCQAMGIWFSGHEIDDSFREHVSFITCMSHHFLAWSVSLLFHFLSHPAV